MKLGKLPARSDAIKLKFSAYLSAKLPEPPKSAGHADMVTEPWGMFGNDQYGDCVWAGAGHETMLWNAEAANIAVGLTDIEILAAYSAVTGFNSADPSSDQGTDMQAAAAYRQKTGITDSKGIVHKVGAYLAIESPKDIRQAIHLFGACGIGINFPSTAMAQFNAGKPWKVVHGASIEGGHYIPGVSYDSKVLNVVTWGKLQPVEWSFITKYMDEGVVYLSEEMLTGGKSLEGFDLATLQADLKAIQS